MKPATKRAPSLQHTGRDVGKASLPQTSRLRLNWLGRVLLALLASGFLLFLGVPLLALLVRESPAVIWAEMGQPDILQASQLSLVTTCLSTAVAVLTGLPVAYLLARTSFPGRKLAETLVTGQRVLPAKAQALGYHFAYPTSQAALHEILRAS